MSLPPCPQFGFPSPSALPPAPADGLLAPGSRHTGEQEGQGPLGRRSGGPAGLLSSEGEGEFCVAHDPGQVWRGALSPWLRPCPTGCYAGL